MRHTLLLLLLTAACSKPNDRPCKDDPETVQLRDTVSEMLDEQKVMLEVKTDLEDSLAACTARVHVLNEALGPRIPGQHR
jgi:hypothetical protein